MRVAYRVPLLLAGFLSLGFGIAAGLARIGFGIELPAPSLAALHGPLMGGAFFGAVISLERAVALDRAWAYLGPLFAGAAGIAWILGAPLAAGAILLTLGGIVLVAASLNVFLRQPALHNACLAFGAACLPVGAADLAAGDVLSATPAWLGFLILTIAGERLELSRFMPPSPAARRVFAVICASVLAACIVAVFAPEPGWKWFAASVLTLAIWLAMKDIARRTVRERGLTRYIAWALLLGYTWLAFGAVVALSDPQFAPGRPAYDAALHAWFLGFVFSMVFGHAPIIVPAVLRVALPYRAWFYLPLVVLHLSVAIRICGSLLDDFALRQEGGACNAAAIALFILTMLLTGLFARRSAPGARAAPVPGER
jgi:hypothetical protein